MKSLNFLLAAAAAATLPCLTIAQTSPQQDPQLSVFLTTSYGLEVDDECQVFSHLQREAVSQLNSAMLGVLRSRYNPDGVAAEEARVRGVAAEQWQGCLSRDANEDKWDLVAQAQVYGDSVLAAPGAMSDAIASCAVGPDGASLTRSEMTAIRQEVLARYESLKYRPQLEEMSANMAEGMEAQCAANGYSPDLEPAYAWKSRKTLEEKTAAGEKTSIAEFGPWTSYRYFAFEDFDEFPVSAYRTPVGGTGRLVGVPLTTEGALGAQGKLYAHDDGTLSVDLSGAADAVEIRADGMEPVELDMAARSGGNNFMAEGAFVLDQARTRDLLALAPETELRIVYRPGGRETLRQFQNFADREGVLPVGRLKAAIAWASAPQPE